MSDTNLQRVPVVPELQAMASQRIDGFNLAPETLLNKFPASIVGSFPSVLEGDSLKLFRVIRHHLIGFLEGELNGIVSPVEGIVARSLV